MKKYVLAFIFFLGCFFVGLSFNDSLVKAGIISVEVTGDSFDSRKISIEISNMYAEKTNKIIVQEFKYCDSVSEEGCQEIVRKLNDDNETLILKFLGMKEYLMEQQSTSTILEYYITSEGDGNKYFLVDIYDKNNNRLEEYSNVFDFILSTLPQRVVLNPDGNGDPSHVYNEIQYSSVRKVNVKIDLTRSESETYTGLIYVCELIQDENKHTLNSCADYELYDNYLEYYIQSYGDGNKKIGVFLEEKDNKTEINDFFDAQRLADNIYIDTGKKGYKTLIKEFYLDTIGPEITIEGDTWVYLEAGKKYTPQAATCKDAVFLNDECNVTNDANVVTIDYTSDKHQIITYEAADKLGNISTATVKIKVEIKQEDNSLFTYLIISGCVLLLTGVILTYVLIKNNEKKKKMSYI